MVPNLIWALDFFGPQSLYGFFLRGPNFFGTKFLGAQIFQGSNLPGTKKFSGPNEIGDHFSYTALRNCTKTNRNAVDLKEKYTL